MARAGYCKHDLPINPPCYLCEMESVRIAEEHGREEVRFRNKVIKVLIELNILPNDYVFGANNDTRRGF